MAAKGKGDPGTQWKAYKATNQTQLEFYSGLEQSLFHTVTEEQTSQRGSSSGSGDEEKFGKWLIKKKRSLEKTTREREEEGISSRPEAAAEPG